ncbi:DUF4136 domain-containing protein [Hymenobacter sp. BRD67]|uniref:DUF4136 domain-containing protein n=1 Tax=Hymenobacter sp. BRD67 TaxID=2675877 RepID=UPI001566271A|nr:DUF4136 domain-containing protein [Hymenobacter sp. BRD67]QKG54057.1 DUF4136 domain-containing protein [Hymenobacter sp. BRD67]
MNRITRFLARPTALAATGLALALGLGSCATTANVGVTSDFDHAVNFRNYHTWAWYPKQANDTEGGPAKGYESFTDQRIRDAVSKDLTAKGLTETTSNPDVYVAYSVRVENKQQVSGYPYGGGYGYPYYGYGYGGFGGYPYGGGAYNYKAGTVIIDIVDARRKELAWRGTGQAQLNQNSISEEETYRIVNSVLGNYPPTDVRRPAAVR